MTSILRNSRVSEISRMKSRSGDCSENVDDIRQLENQVWAAVEHDLVKIDLSVVGVRHEPLGVRFRVESKSERHEKEIDKRGKIK